MKYLIMILSMLLISCSDYEGRTNYVECQETIDVGEYDIDRFTRRYVCENTEFGGLKTRVCESRVINDAGICLRLYMRMKTI